MLRFIEDRNLNGIAALAVRLQLYRAGRQTAEEVILAADGAVAKIMVAVEEVRKISRGAREQGCRGEALEKIACKFERDA